MSGHPCPPLGARRRSPWRRLLGAAAAVALGCAGLPAAGTAVASPSPTRATVSPPTSASTPHTVTYDGYSFMVDGKRTYLWSGEFHYFRLPSPDLWMDIFQKMKAAGFNSTSLYFDWGYHSASPGTYDFTGVRDLDRLLDMAEQAGLYVIARPAPYINAEVDSGGLAAWMTRMPGKNRSADPDYLKYSDEWQSKIDPIIARHQVTNGGGSVIAYQVENEYYNGSAAGQTYLKHMEDKARADGITVPLTGNNNGTFNSGIGALDVDGPDAYPQGFNCSNPTQWNGVPDLSYDHPAGRPLYTPEFQGGAFDPWGGPGYDKCAQLINDQFANVFYKQNIAVGATAQSFYMTYGGTNWGWLGMPQNYTSYDYGAAIRETRQLDPKFYEDKLIGYMTQSVPALTKTDAIAAVAPDNPGVIDTARRNPDTGTQFHVVRHADSTSTTADTSHISLDFAAKPVGDTHYTYDDPDPALAYTGAWSHVADQSYTAGDYQHTESFSKVAGDSVTVPFSGTAVRWIGSKTNNHGRADIYLDDVLQGTVDTAGSQSQAVLFSKTGLTDGSHTLKIVVDGTHSTSSTDSFVAVDAIDVPAPGAVTDPTYPVVPQQPGTAISLAGRDSHIIVANEKIGDSQLQYSTSEIMTQATIGARDVAVLYGNKGSDGETVLRYGSPPTVRVTGGSVTSTYDAASGDLRLNYQHDGLARVTVTEPGQRPLLLLLADKDTAKTFWRQDTAAGPVLVRGTHLLRTATSSPDGTQVDLTGDNAGDNDIEVITAARKVTWNGRPVQTRPTTTATLTGVISVAAPVALPALDGWKKMTESPEAQPGFDDSRWAVADKTTSNSSTAVTSLPVLFADDYGFHTGNVWYRGRFRAAGGESGIQLTSLSGGGAQAFSVWLNGTFVGSSTTGSGRFIFPAGTVKAGADNVVSVLTVNMGHEEDYNSTNNNRTARGLTSATLVGAPLTPLTWRLQGNTGGEQIVDTVRGPLSTGGLYGERAGWSLAGYPDASWSPVNLPSNDTTPGVTWYRDDVTLALPRTQDTSVGLTITDDPSRRYRATLFVNGWQVGNYVNYLGPQTSFPVPNGILNPHGANSIAIAVWNLDGTTGGLGKVALTNYGSYASSLRVGMNKSPAYDARRYAQPSAPETSTSLTVPGQFAAGQSFTATSVTTVRAGSPADTSLRQSLSVPAGWTASALTPVTAGRLRAGQTFTVSWRVTVPAGTLPSAVTLSTRVGFTQRSAHHTATDERVMTAVPPAPPSGSVPVSSLTFLSATNGWGPVERDTSNGDNQPGDGATLTMAGTTYSKGLGTNADSDVSLYLAGHCTRLTAQVGVDDETRGAGSVTFSVVADGRTLVTTPTLKGGATAVPLDVDLTGAQVVELVVGNGGDGNGNDHGDWALPTLTCT